MNPQATNNDGESNQSFDETLDQEDIAAIQEAIDMKNGDKGIPFEEFDRGFRARHGIPPRS